VGGVVAGQGGVGAEQQEGVGSVEEEAGSCVEEEAEAEAEAGRMSEEEYRQKCDKLKREYERLILGDE
jgi:hypothetical protein